MGVVRARPGCKDLWMMYSYSKGDHACAVSDSPAKQPQYMRISDHPGVYDDNLSFKRL